MTVRADVVVVGGGAMGSAAAWWLAREGREVVLLERAAEGHARAGLLLHTRGATVWPAFIHHRQPYIYGLFTPGQGVKVAEHHTGEPTDPDHRSFDVDPAGRERVVRYVEDWFPGLVSEPASAETCLYTTTPTQDFVVDRAGPLVVAAGFSGHGFKFVPLVGRLLADVALGGTGPDRLGLRLALGAPALSDQGRDPLMGHAEEAGDARHREPLRIEGTRLGTAQLVARLLERGQRC